MIEVIDRDTNQKMIAMIFCSICYRGDCYLIYCIRREKDDANLFVSKLVQNSQGYVMDSNFLNGEKEVLDNIVQRLLNRDSIEVLEKDGFSIQRDVTLDGVCYFDIERCYVSTVSKTLIKECLIYYHLISEKLFDQPVIEVASDKRKFNEGFISNIALIIFGIILVLFCIWVIYGVLFG